MAKVWVTGTPQDGPTIVITAARVDTASGVPAATIDLVQVGGGSRTVTIDGVAEEQIHASSTVHHVRLLSPDRMIPDQLREVGSYDAAVELGRAYAVKLDEHAAAISAIAGDLRV